MRSLCTATREQPLLNATREKPVQQQRLSTVKNKFKKFLRKRTEKNKGEKKKDFCLLPKV